MELIILDEFSPWMIYTMAATLCCGVVASMVVIVRSQRSVARRRIAPVWTASAGGLPVIFAIAGSVALWFLATSMFYRFHAVSIGADLIDLVFFWPRPALTIKRSELVGVTLVASYRSCGYLELTTREEVFRSVSFRDCKLAEKINAELSKGFSFRQ